MSKPQSLALSRFGKTLHHTVPHTFAADVYDTATWSCVKGDGRFTRREPAPKPKAIWDLAPQHTIKDNGHGAPVAPPVFDIGNGAGNGVG